MPTTVRSCSINKMKSTIEKDVKTRKRVYSLTDYGFDSECIYQLGDLSDLLSSSLKELLPDINVRIDERIENGRYTATIFSNETSILDIYADTDIDWLPDDFWGLFDSIPKKLEIDKMFCPINPRLTGQGVWYICGREKDLRQAKKEGLPIVLDGEDIFDMNLDRYE